MFNPTALTLVLPPFDDADDGDARALALEAFFEAAEAESARAQEELEPKVDALIEEVWALAGKGQSPT